MGCGGSQPAKPAQSTAQTSPEPKEQSTPAETQPADGGDAAQASTASSLEFEVTFEKQEGQTLGLTLVQPEPGIMLVVKALKAEGLIIDWNAAQENASERKVTQGDMIVVVNGVSGNSAKMMEAITATGTMVLTLKRAAAAEQPTTEAPATAEVATEAPPADQPPAAETAAATATENAVAAEEGLNDEKQKEASFIEQPTNMCDEGSKPVEAEVPDTREPAKKGMCGCF